MLISNDEMLKRVEDVLKKYCNPKKEFDGITPREIAQKVVDAANGKVE